MRTNKSYKEMFPNNCPVIEVDGDGNEVGTCTYYLKDGKCPRHGSIGYIPFLDEDYDNGNLFFDYQTLQWKFEPVNCWKLFFWADFKSPYKSVGLGWIRFVWCFDDFDRCVDIEFMPTDKTLFSWKEKRNEF